MSKLSEDQVAVNLSLLPLWKHEGGSLVKTFVKETFMEAIDFVVAIAKLAEAANHQPDLLIQFNKVTITSSTHDSHGVTGKDFLLAQQIESIG
ncbi:4a-hydroxytetrahydrobiopterin dehydratase [Paenibacillus psychroresistens]|uniref:4a-hydroxytetrahydrobiopterin dehydratase n=1 Tax=Paenibacillus psychroresistens TaxID=1778678 RepID=A0A6B8RKR3_9BACL|nr:4a-hydroxytetrahydrobiopterin dehydratase [Paenibacillus psychroresistens]QGQ96629.1 4a-hydroxytetrahydrobiopterin dehydratase [Paenibacillus psychroresistens]